MLKAKLDSVRKNKKGFSLVELIIVVAIMVALIAVLAPSYVKYVTRSRDSALQTAAEDLATAIKTDYADPEGTLAKPSAAAQVTVKISGGTLDITGDSNIINIQSIKTLAGVDSGKKMQEGTTGLKFIITISSDGVVTGPKSSKG